MTVPCGRSALSARSRLSPRGRGSGRPCRRRGPPGAVPAAPWPPPGVVRVSSTASKPSARRRRAASRRARRPATSAPAPAGEERGEQADGARAPDDDRTAGMPAPRRALRAAEASASACRMPLAQIGPIWATKMPRIGSSSAQGARRTAAPDRRCGRSCGRGRRRAAEPTVADRRRRPRRPPCSPETGPDSRPRPRRRRRRAARPSRREVGVRALEEGELGAGGQAGDTASRPGTRRRRVAPRGTTRCRPSRGARSRASGSCAAQTRALPPRGRSAAPSRPSGRRRRRGGGSAAPPHRACGCGSPCPAPRRRSRGRPDERVALGRRHRPAPADVDHQLELGRARAPARR